MIDISEGTSNIPAVKITGPCILTLPTCILLISLFSTTSFKFSSISRTSSLTPSIVDQDRWIYFYNIFLQTIKVNFFTYSLLILFKENNMN